MAMVKPRGRAKRLEYKDSLGNIYMGHVYFPSLFKKNNYMKVNFLVKLKNYANFNVASKILSCLCNLNAPLIFIYSYFTKLIYWTS